MFRTALRLLMTLIAGLALLAVAGSGATAQDAVPAHPAHIHQGTCANLDPNPQYPLNNVTAAAPDAPFGAVEVSNTTVDVTLDELLASPHAINVHRSAEDIQTYIACGDIAGPVVNGLLLIPLREQSDSTYYGIAALAASDTGGTNVSIYIAPAPAAVAGATPVAETAVATETQAAVATETEAAAAQEVQVTIKDFAFMPQTIEVPVGTTVTWTNQDVTQHTVYSKTGVFQSDILQQGDTFSYTFDEPGTYDYICSLHPNMMGQVVVTAP